MVENTVKQDPDARRMQRRTDLLERFTKAKLPVRSIEELREKAERLCGKARPIPEGERIVGIVEYRDGTIIDVVRAKA